MPGSMDGNGIFQTLTAFILALFAAVFMLVYFYDNRQKFAGWLALAYSLGLVTFFLDISPSLTSSTAAVITNTTFWGTSGAILAAACARCEKPFPTAGFLFLMICGYATTIGFSMGTPNLMWRSSMANVIAGLIIALGLPALYQKRDRKIDRAVGLVLGFIALVFCIRPILAYWVFAAAEDYASYTNSPYTLILHLTSALSALAGAVVMLLAAGLDMAERLHRVSVTDHLTGLHNRRGLDEILSELEASGDLTDRAIITLDIDEFKALNDIHGHEVGDAVLKRLGATLGSLIDQIGDVARTGGEEFLILLNGPCSPAAMHFAEQVRSAIALINHGEIGRPGTVTASFGVAVVRQHESSRSALRRADMALYAAKDSGRNCVRAAAEFSMKSNVG